MSFPDSFQARLEPLDQIEHLDTEQYYDLWDEFADDSPELAALFSELARQHAPRAARHGSGVTSSSARGATFDVKSPGAGCAASGA